MASVTIQDALDYCLGNPDGLSVEQLMSKFPEYRDELQPMLVLSANIVAVEPPPVPVERRAAMKQRLMDAASTASAKALVAVPVAQAPGVRPWWENLAALVRRPAMAGALGVFAIVALLWWSAAGSLPDSPLYGVKLGSEDLFRNFTGSTSGRIESHLNSAGARLADIREMERRGKIAQANVAIEAYRSNIATSASLWKQTSGEERTDIAKSLYVSSARGVVGLGAVAPNLSGIAASVRANIIETINTLEEVRADTGATLVSSNIDVNALLLEADIEPSTVPTALPRFAAVTATVVAPAVAGSTQTSIAASASETSISAAAQATAEVIIAASGGSITGTPSARILAAQTVLAGGSGSGIASARQTVLAPVAATEGPARMPTRTEAARPTQQAPTPTFSPVPPQPTRTVQPPTARPATHTPRPPRATNTSRPPQVTNTPRPTNTRRPTNTHIVQPPTRLPVVTQVPLPTSSHVTGTSVPGASVTSRPTESLDPSTTPEPTNTPIILSTLVPLPTVTIEVPPLPTHAQDTPRPTNTSIIPLPTIVQITPPALPTITLIAPPPTQPATRTVPPGTTTPLPLPTEIACALELEEVDVSCGPGLCVNASGIVRNESGSSIRATWTAELRVKVGSGAFIVISTQTGNREFAPGNTPLEPAFCVPLPVGTTRIQIRLGLVYGSCSEQESSGAIQPCLLP